MSGILDHFGFHVRDYAKSKAFYGKALAPLGISMLRGGDNWGMLGREGKPQFWIGEGGPPAGHTHIAFAARNREEVRQFHAAALAAGGKDNGGPGLRPYHPNYYGAFVIDPDGHNVEAVCHDPEAA